MNKVIKELKEMMGHITMLNNKGSKYYMYNRNKDGGIEEGMFYPWNHCKKFNYENCIELCSMKEVTAQ